MKTHTTESAKIMREHTAELASRYCFHCRTNIMNETMGKAVHVVYKGSEIALESAIE